MAAANIKTAKTPLLINIETYFLGRIIGLGHRKYIGYVPYAYNVCKSNMAAKMATENIKHYNNHNQTYKIAYMRNTCYTLYLHIIHET